MVRVYRSWSEKMVRPAAEKEEQSFGKVFPTLPLFHIRQPPSKAVTVVVRLSGAMTRSDETNDDDVGNDSEEEEDGDGDLEDEVEDYPGRS
ncbi:hypothetical protein L1887_29636 [Cichorium endivia]|nr:hypothetical protein L1887_29636 [Cichorium endivia]